MGIRRFGSAYVPMDEALAFTAWTSLDGLPVYEADMPQARMGAYDACLTEEFMRALAMNSGLTLHMRAQYGRNAHHITEALFKSLGLAMKTPSRWRDRSHLHQRSSVRMNHFTAILITALEI